MRASASNKPFVLSAVVLTSIFFLPFLLDGFGRTAGFLYLGDVVNLWLPQIATIFDANKNYIFQGVDLYTQGGASDIFLRPNLLTHSPLIFFASQVFDLENEHSLFRLTFSIHVLYTYLANYYLHKLCEKFLGFPRILAIFATIAYTFSVTTIRAYGFTPFLLSALIFPAFLYIVLDHQEKKSWSHVLGASFLVTLGLHTGYVTFSALILLLTALFSIVWQFYIAPKPGKNLLQKLYCARPFLLACFVHLPLYLAYFYRIRTFITMGKVSLAEAAHNHALVPSEIFGLLTHTVSYQNVYIEQQIVWGMLACAILGLSFIFLRKADLEGMTYRLFVTNAAFYFGSILVMYGVNTAASDLFYYAVPAIGEMHYYQRYLVVTSLFFWLDIAILLSALVKKIDRENGPLGIKLVAFSCAFLAFVVVSAVHVGKLQIEQLFVTELLLSVGFVFSLLLFRPAAIIAYASVVSLVVPLACFYNFSRSEIWTPTFQAHENIVFNNEENEKLINYFRQNSSKEIIKYVDLVDGLNTGYLPKNYPWWVRHKVSLSSYVGYDMHLASHRDYQRLFVTSRDPVTTAVSYSGVDWEWLEKTGAEFAVYETKQMDPTIASHVDISGPSLDLSHGLRVARLRASEKGSNSIFDNGYLRLTSGGVGTVADFKTNQFGSFNLSVDLKKEGKLTYLFWPNQNLKLSIDGVDTAWENQDGLFTASLPAGRHHVLISYHDRFLTIFVGIYFFYLSSVFLSILYGFRHAFLSIQKRAVKRMKGFLRCG